MRGGLSGEGNLCCVCVCSRYVISQNLLRKTSEFAPMQLRVPSVEQVLRSYQDNLRELMKAQEMSAASSKKVTLNWPRTTSRSTLSQTRHHPGPVQTPELPPKCQRPVS